MHVSFACYNGTMKPYSEPIGLLYDNDGYVEATPPMLTPGAEPYTGPIGRRVAGKEFLDAFLTYGTWTKLVALVRGKSSTDTLHRYFQDHPSHRVSPRELVSPASKLALNSSCMFSEPLAHLLIGPRPFKGVGVPMVVFGPRSQDMRLEFLLLCHDSRFR